MTICQFVPPSSERNRRPLSGNSFSRAAFPTEDPAALHVGADTETGGANINMVPKDGGTSSAADAWRATFLRMPASIEDMIRQADKLMYAVKHTSKPLKLMLTIQ